MINASIFFGRAGDGRPDVGPRIGGRAIRAHRQNGKPHPDSEFRGKLMIAYFGYRFCPDVCQTGPDRLIEILRKYLAGG